MPEGRFIGIDVGGTKIVTAVLEGGRHEVLEPVATRTDSSDSLVAQLVEQIQLCRGGEAQAIAVGLPSIISSRPAASVTASTSRSRTCRCARCSRSAAGVRCSWRTTRRARRSPRRRRAGGSSRRTSSCSRSAPAWAAGWCSTAGLPRRDERGRGRATLIGLDLANGAPADPGTFPQPGSLEALASGRALDRLALESARAHPKSFLGRRLARGDEITGHDAVEARARATCTAST